LAAFVRNGGTLLVDAAGGDADFADSARDALAAIFDAEPQPLDNEAGVYRVKYMTVGNVRYRPATYRRKPDAHAPRLEAIDVDGRPAVIVSREDLTAGLAGYPAYGVDGYAPGTAAQPGDAYRIVRNVVLYATGLVETTEPETEPDTPGPPTASTEASAAGQP
jgi:hypothetical protein